MTQYSRSCQYIHIKVLGFAIQTVKDINFFWSWLIFIKINTKIVWQRMKNKNEKLLFNTEGKKCICNWVILFQFSISVFMWLNSLGFFILFLEGFVNKIPPNTSFSSWIFAFHGFLPSLRKTRHGSWVPRSFKRSGGVTWSWGNASISFTMSPKVFPVFISKLEFNYKN